MLSRTAENLYWLARYVERAEYLARTIEATLRVTALPNTYTGKTNEWDSALLTAGVSASFYEVYKEANEQNVVNYLSFAPSNPSSIRNCIENARLNSRSVRTALTGEMWDTINSAWIELQEVWGKGTSTREELAKFLRFVQETSLRFDGSAYRTMLRNDAYWFSRLGLHLERADNTARILDVRFADVEPNSRDAARQLEDFYYWTSILSSVSALEIYRKVYRDVVTPARVVELMILNQQMPRSLLASLEGVCVNLAMLRTSGSNQCERFAGKLRAELVYSDIRQIFEAGLHAYLTQFLARVFELGNLVARTYLMLPVA